MKKAVIIFVGVGLFASRSAWAARDNACWNRNLQRMDYYSSPPQGGDTGFFSVSSQGQAGVISLLYPAKASMKELPISLYEARVRLGGSAPTGCTNSFFNTMTYQLPVTGTSYSSLAGVYSASKTYPDPEMAYATALNPTTDGLTTNTAYRYMKWGPTPTATGETFATACTNASSTWTLTNNGGFLSSVLMAAACQTCLSNQGYWLNPTVGDNDVTQNAAVFRTNFLRFYPPKWVVLKLAYKRMIAGPLLGNLREGVIGPNGSGVAGASGDGVGASLIQKLLPDSCSGGGAQNGAGILSSKLKAVDTLSYTSTAFPLAEMLFNDGWYQSGNSSTWCCSGTPAPYFSNSAVYSGSAMPTDGKGGPCPGCNQDFLVVFSDGRGDTANPYCTKKSDGTLPGPCQAEQQCSTLGMGAEKDGDNFLDPSITNGAGAAITGSAVRLTPSGTCDMDFADDVAKWMATHPQSQNSAGSAVTTYVVGIGSESYGKMSILEQIAAKGGGSYAHADNFNDFEDALSQTLIQIVQKTQSFSVAAITTVQTRGNTFAFIPRFTPIQGNDWAGKLYRFNLFNEVSAGCVTSNYGTKSLVNPNGNSSCTDVYLKDANGDFVGDDTSGNIVLLDTTKPYPWPTKPATGTAPNTVPQYGTPYWEASDVLSQRITAVNAATSTDKRSIYTVYDSDGNGSYDKRISFDTDSANLSTLTTLLALNGISSDICVEMAAKTAHTYTAESDCAKDLINFIRGQDVFLQNTLNQTKPPPTNLYARPNPLGDIYHSSPILVTPPAPTFMCDLGVLTQCSSSLYSSSLTPNGSTAYGAWQTANKYRQEVILVGANDGMLHAFDAGSDTTGDDPDTSTVEGSTYHYYSKGTGREVWAFIPPDLLPKLRLYAIGTKHEMFVDGTPMVKDIWVDGSGATTANYKKETDEFRTVAIVGEREGGRSFFALDVSTVTDPKFLWSWPPPGSTDSLNAGQSWNDHAPAPPPIGPVAIADTTGPLTVNGVKAVEKYVVALNGGYDQNLVRGAGYYVLDAWTGNQVYRAARIDTSDSTDPRSKMFPVAALPAFLDRDGDGLYDTLFVGDTLGQVFVSNLATPGHQITGSTLVDNWFAARAFTEFKGSLSKISPFFQMASAAILTNGVVRVVLGSGSRDHIKNPAGDNCSLADPFSCIRAGCTINVKEDKYDNDTHYVHSEWKYSAGGTALSTNTFSSDTNATGNTCSDSLSVDISTSISCVSSNWAYSNKIDCTWPSTIECVGTGKPDDTSLSPVTSGQNARLYSFRLFDTVNRTPFTTLATAKTYDSYALTDSDLVNADTATASATGNGYYLNYANSTEKTASGALILAGCTLVNTLLPGVAITNSCGANITADTAYSYQADAITGAIACGTSAPASTATVRYGTQTAIVPPPMPTPVVAVNANSGTVTYSGISLAPGAAPSQFTIAGGDVIGPVQWIELSRKMHECRHTGQNCK